MSAASDLEREHNPSVCSLPGGGAEQEDRTRNMASDAPRRGHSDGVAEGVEMEQNKRDRYVTPTCPKCGRWMKQWRPYFQTSSWAGQVRCAHICQNPKCEDGKENQGL